MPAEILFVAATSLEADLLNKVRFPGPWPLGVLSDSHANVLVTGVGIVPTLWAMQKRFLTKPAPSLVINIGIAGSYREDMGIGAVVLPESDCFGDSGIEDDQRFLTLFEAGLAGRDDPPFSAGLIRAPKEVIDAVGNSVRQVKAVTVSTATGSDQTRARLAGIFNPDIETMEGAAFFYACSMEKVPFLALRSVSNMVGKRDKSKWNIKLALDNLAAKLEELIPKIIGI
jgi:futalosine hydrolase